MSFSQKLFLSVLFVLFLSTSITTFLVSNKSFSSTERLSKDYVQKLAVINSYKAKQNLDKSIVLSYGIAASLETYLKEKQAYSKANVLELMENNLKKNPYVLGMWIALQKDVLFENKLELANKNGHDKDGRFTPYLVKSKG